MNIARQHWEFKLRFNKLNSNHKEDLNPAKIDSFLNQAPIWMIHNYGQMFEKYQFLKDMFSTLVVKDELVDVFNVANNVYEFKLNNLKEDYFHHVRSSVSCNGSYIDVSIMEHDEGHKRTSFYTKPNYKWKRLLGEIGRSSDGTGQSLFVYSDKVLTTINITYLKQPQEVFFGGYDSIEYVHCIRTNQNNCNQFLNQNSDPVNSDLPEQFHNFQVDVAVFLASGKTENINLQRLLKDNLIKIN